MKIAYVIGRFQPFHLGHKAMIETALRIADQVMIVLGDTGCAPDHRDPWSVDEREQMIKAVFPGCPRDRMIFSSVEDIPYDNVAWAQNVRHVTRAPCKPAESFLVGFRKDDSSFYLDLFPEWKFVTAEFGDDQGSLNATDVRGDMYRGAWAQVFRRVPKPVYDIMNDMNSARRAGRAREYLAAKDDEAEWACIATGKYGGPILTAVDAVVTCDYGKYVAMIRRGGEIGNGRLALPGGFVNPTERLGYAALRELKEETRLHLSINDRALCQPGSTTAFDAPKRSSRGRIITHALWRELHGKPEDYPLYPADDAEWAGWIPIADLYKRRREIFSDHRHIIKYFTPH